MTKKTVKLIVLSVAAVLVIVAIGIAVLFGSRPRGISNIENVSAQKDLVMGATWGGIYYMNVNETGIFYLDGDFMKYCDYASGEIYSICDKANCLHNSSSCGAYLVDGTAFAAYQNKLYAFVLNETDHTYDLMSMDMNGQDRKKITAIEIGEFKVGEWYLENFGENTYFGYGKAYTYLEYKQVKSTESTGGNTMSRQLLLTIDLATGEQTVLFEDEGIDLYHSAKYAAISKDRAVILTTKNEAGLVAEWLDEAIEAGELDHLYDMMEDVPEPLRDNYWMETLEEFYMWYASYFITDTVFTAYSYDFKTKDLCAFYSEEMELYCSSDGQPISWIDPMIPLGWYGDDFVYLSNDRTILGTPAQSKLWSWDFDTNEPGLLEDIGAGGTVRYIFGTAGNAVLDGRYLICTGHTEDADGVYIRRFDLESAKMEELYFDACANVTFRFLGETADHFIGEVVAIDGNGEGYSKGCGIILKEDYYSGNLDAVEMLLSS